MPGRRFVAVFRATGFFLIAMGLAGCGPGPTPAVSVSAESAAETHPPPTPAAAISPAAVTQPSATAQATGYEFPDSIDPASRYMFYLHGVIVEEQGLPAISPVYGEYEYAGILKALEDHGFVVISEQRAKGTDAVAYSREVVRQVTRLLEAHVPPGNITVLGASKGAWIAARVSYLLEEAGVNYVLLGTCYPDMIDEWKSQAMRLHGNVLTIYDFGDEYAGSCTELFRLSEGKGLGRHKEIVLHVGTGHGILYKPLDEWVLPTVAWALK